MSNFANASEITLSIGLEASYGGALSGGMTALRVLDTENLTMDAETIPMKERDPDAQVKSERRGTSKSSGTLPMYLHKNTIDYLEAVMRGTETAQEDVDATTISAASADSSFNDSGDGFGNFVAGDIIRTSGFSTDANNGLFRVVSATASKLIVAVTSSYQDAVADESAGSSFTVSRLPRLQMGTTDRSFKVEKKMPSATKFRQFGGIVFTSLGLNFSPNEAVEVSLGVLGKPMTLGASTVGAPAAVTDEDGLVGIDMSSLTQDGTELGKISSIELNLDWGSSAPAVLNTGGAPASVFHSKGNVTGSMTAFFTDEGYTEKYLNEIEMAASWGLLSPDGWGYWFGIDRLKLNAFPTDSGANGEALTQSLGYRGLKHSVSGSFYMIRIPEPA